ncbi:MAG: Gfo/Idh/MocA family oxidoreductase [Planctomycetes bacterium]|nr:Gfo/Idh/MocA family oxidoreductase [Planctomycetota bacterium]
MSVRLGIIGCGGIAQGHMKKLAEIPQAVLAAFADVNAPAAAAAADQYGGKPYRDYREMYDNEKLDAVYVCVPPDAHGDIETEAAGRGLHLFVEKPVNIDARRAVQIADAIEKAGVVSAVGYSLRYLPVFEQLRAVVANHPVRQAHVFRWGGLPQTPWWRKMASSGGQLVEMVTHQLDLLRALIGEVETAAAVYTSDYHGTDGVDVPSHYNAVLGFVSGAGATVSTGCKSPSGRNDMVLVTDAALLQVKYSEGITSIPDSAVDVPVLHDAPSIDACFIRAVEGDASALKSDYRDGVLSLAVSLACNLSAAEHRMVKVQDLLKA